MKSSVEEVLRFESSNQLGNRITTEETQLGGILMPRGTLITIGIGAANRDPDIFPDPDRFDIARNPDAPSRVRLRHPYVRRHQPGAARRAAVAIERFLKRFPDYRPDGAPTRSRRARFRGFTALPVRLS